MRPSDASEIVFRADRILEEHRQLHGHLRAVEAALSGLGPPGLAGLASSLADLAPFLEDHFETEEQEGLFETIQTTWPQATRACERLRGEHRTLLTRLEELRVVSAGPAVSEQALGALAAGTRSLLKDLARHEELENELLAGSLDDAVAAQD
jgi:iron-sulfur cluster repair protein YtfE (RIC family)